MAEIRLLSDLVDAHRLASGELDGSSIALTDGTNAVTWDAYVDQVARFASVLHTAGVRPGDRVGIRLAKSCTSFVAVHAVIRTGAVMVPLDPMAPLDVAASVIADAGIEVLITDHRTAKVADVLTTLRVVILPGGAGRAPESAVSRPAVIDQTDIDAADPAPAARMDPDAPAYIIYTSGSTGQPKGIAHTHASALAYASAAAAEYELRSDDCFANIAPLHFDQSTFELYAAPLVGGRVLVVPDPVLRFPASVSELVERERVTIWYSVPYLLEQLTTRGALPDRDLSSLRWVLFGGESYPHQALAELMRLLPDASFSNVYGPAEVNQCTAYEVRTPPVGPVPIGTAWSAARIRLVEPDDLGCDVQRGDPGIILVSSPTMMQGYWNRSEQTEATMLADDTGVRWYITGDLGRADEHGVVTFLGRVDHQVKMRGYRLELEAIDAALREAPGVNAATVVVERPANGDDRLIALVELSPTEQPADIVARITETLRRRLPRYAVPSEIRSIPALPRTSSGKVDRIAASGLLTSHP